MKLIFLDIDGVLNHINHRERSPYHKGTSFYPPAVEQLKEIIQETDAYLVLSSTWRKGSSSIELQRELFSIYDLEKRLIGKTPVLPLKGWVSPERGHEIQAFLDAFQESVETFIIIDDDNDMAHLTHRLVRTSPYHDGLTTEKKEEAIRLLKDSTAQASKDSFNPDYHEEWRTWYKQQNRKEEKLMDEYGLIKEGNVVETFADQDSVFRRFLEVKNQGNYGFRKLFFRELKDHVKLHVLEQRLTELNEYLASLEGTGRTYNPTTPISSDELTWLLENTKKHLTAQNE